MFKKKLLVAFIPLGFVVTSCTDDKAKSNSLPAHADPDQQAEIGTHVIFDRSASADSENKVFSIKWSLIKRLTGSSALLTSFDTEKKSFVYDEAGAYEAELTIRNGSAESRDKVLITGTTAEPFLLDGVITNLTSSESTLEYVEISSGGSSPIVSGKKVNIVQPSIAYTDEIL
jgi:hypothetical protein